MGHALGGRLQLSTLRKFPPAPPGAQDQEPGRDGANRAADAPVNRLAIFLTHPETYLQTWMRRVVESTRDRPTSSNSVQFNRAQGWIPTRKDCVRYMRIASIISDEMWSRVSWIEFMWQLVPPSKLMGKPGPFLRFRSNLPNCKN